ncbi:Alanine--tRNA ligase [Balamuthia mandrillaris]
MEANQQRWPCDKVRKTFIEFFQGKDHLFVPSSSVVPHNDPTLLFANAGMNQFKPIFLGQVDPKSEQASWKRAANSQKCIRAGGKHNDLDDVGKDTYHHTFFEMLGNWSFGDYFKQEAIDWAMELLTEVYGLDSSRLYATYFGGSDEDGLPADEEARELWKKHLPAERILPFGKKENFWEMGETGPCGPCSEIHYDRIGGRDVSSLVNKDDPNVIEIWNLVFMQFNREQDGSLKRLPASHVDTGMGFERLTSILQDVKSNYDTDIFAPIFARIQEVTGAPAYAGKVGKEDTDLVDTAYRVVADHIRTLCFAISDGAAPGPDDRDYILRKVLRRAVRFGKEILGAKDGFFHQLVGVVLELMGDAFPQLRENPAHIVQTIKEEEESFTATLDKGLKKYHKATAKLTPGQVLSGKAVFKLYDTYGFPVELTQLMAEEKGLGIDWNGFKKEKEAAQQRSRQAQRLAMMSGGPIFELDANAVSELQNASLLPTDDSFKYQTGQDVEAVVKAIWTTNKAFEQYSSGEAGLVLDCTNFYAESGGQMYDMGVMKVKGREGVTFAVCEVQSYGGYVLHSGTCSGGEIRVGDVLQLTVELSRRLPLMANHTTTHLVNHALRAVLGGVVDQKGSLVLPERLRFDFSYGKALTAEQLEKVDQHVQAVIARDLQVYIQNVALQQALAMPCVRAMFGETYPDPVRVVSVGAALEELLQDPDNPKWSEFSVELCGGTHLSRSSEAECFTIVAEEALARGIRRLVALTGKPAQEAIHRGEELAKAVALLKNKKGEDLKCAVTDLAKQLDEAVVPASKRYIIRDSLDQFRRTVADSTKNTKAEQLELAQQYAEQVVSDLQASPDSRFHVGILQVNSFTVALTNAIKAIQEKHPSLPVLLLSADNTNPKKPKATVVCQVPQSVVDSTSLKANGWAAAVAEVLGGKGGGKPTTAQGSGPKLRQLDAALVTAKDYASRLLAP